MENINMPVLHSNTDSGGYYEIEPHLNESAERNFPARCTSAGFAIIPDRYKISW
jgi:hypothetical protein